jgi:hypothetical protein
MQVKVKLNPLEAQALQPDIDYVWLPIPREVLETGSSRKIMDAIETWLISTNEEIVASVRRAEKDAEAGRVLTPAQVRQKMGIL